MRKLFNYFYQTNSQVCQHKSKILKVCYNDTCKNDRYICQKVECLDVHRNHLIVNYTQFLQTLQRAKKQIQQRQKIQKIIDEYEQKIIKQIQKLFQISKKNLFNHIDQKFSNKQFTQIYKRYKNNQDYISLLINYQYTAQNFLYESIVKKIKQKQKNISKIINIDNIGLNNSILPQENIKQLITYSRIDNVKSILPFRCNLTLKFQASKNSYLTKKLYDLNLHGPILILAQSYKHKIFGGYSPTMFPKEQEYVEDRKGDSFLFSLDQRVIMKIKPQYKRYSIKGGRNLWFGRGDLVISNECHKGNISWAEIGRAYQLPSAASGKQNQWLAGAWYFRILEYQIYQIDIQQHKEPAQKYFLK